MRPSVAPLSSKKVPPLTAAVLAVAAGLDHRGHFLIGEELRDLVDHAHAFHEGAHACLHLGRKRRPHWR